MLAAALACAAVLAGCDQAPAEPARPDASAPSAREASPPVRPSTSSAPPVYQPVRDPCAVVDHQLLSSTLGARGNDVVPPKTSTALQLVQSWCSPTYGPLTDRTLVGVEFEVVSTGSLSDMFTGIRAAIQNDDPTTDIPVLGESAYSYVDPQTGPHVAVLDGNLSVTMRAKSISGNPRPDSTFISLMTEAIQRMLTTLPRR
ncbi:hypothetical protein DMB66_00010 [Actinoplanes sp. ATCC 53533]|nr:hypothetical protein DMB66_00010 [Actinoplanes sp. ATCC 53533]